jgi:toxin secretion/phage lysis holin
MKKENAWEIQGVLAAVGAYLSAKLGALFPVMCLFAVMMVVDYVSGMAASRVEAIDHPNDPAYGWDSKKGMKGILKKLGYLCVIAVAMGLDYVLLMTSETFGFHMPVHVFFGLLVTVWCLLNELLSIIENAGRLGASVPEWLSKYIAVLRNKINSQGEEENTQK